MGSATGIEGQGSFLHLCDLTAQGSPHHKELYSPDVNSDEKPCARESIVESEKKKKNQGVKWEHIGLKDGGREYKYLFTFLNA